MKKTKKEQQIDGLLMLNKVSRLERDEHKDFVKILDENNIKFFHTANEGRKTPKTASLHKAMGVKAGVADFVIVTRSENTRTVPNVWIEFKREKNGLSAEQTSWKNYILSTGGIYKMVYTAKQAAKFMIELGYNIKGNFDE